MMQNRQLFIVLFCNLITITGLAQTGYSKKNISLKTKLIVYKLNKYDEISGAVIGRAPRKPKQYEVYEKLKSKTSESELYELTNHPNPTVRAYGFLGLVETNSPNVLKVILKNQSDTVIVTYKYGCVGKKRRLIEYMTGFIPSYIEKNKITLTEQEKAIVQREHEAWYVREIENKMHKTENDSKN